MNVTDYTYLMNKPDAITEKQADALGSVLNEFPYFQSARALRLKGLFNQNSFKYNYALKVTAAHTTDRSILFDFITSETFTSIQSEYYDRKLRDLLDITVFDSEIISPEEIKKVIEVRIDPIEQSILDSIKEATTVTFEEPVKVEEKPIDPIIAQSILTSIKEATPIIKEPTPTFFEEIVEEEIPEVRIDPIEQSILTSIKEASKVVFEEAKVTETPKEIEVPETIKIAEENLEIGKPLDFSVNEKHSFQEWLKLSRTEPIDRTNETPKEEIIEETEETIAEAKIIEEEKKKKAELIDKFIETNPKISPVKQTTTAPAAQFDLNKEENSYLMTETLARVYLEQKKYTKAIQAYEILILKYPEKISFFADRISDIKILQQNNNNN
ncbi:tetratricopeptide repeat protein [Flavobacterium sp. FlaQc-57]|uniref:tetratricopeptide repeat protein n=1 Tax=Flavobacterium sp. FlaQc-57 TaxID=3374186 RepID=UPI00375650FD